MSYVSLPYTESGSGLNDQLLTNDTLVRLHTVEGDLVAGDGFDSLTEIQEDLWTTGDAAYTYLGSGTWTSDATHPWPVAVQRNAVTPIGTAITR